MSMVRANFMEAQIALFHSLSGGLKWTYNVLVKA